MKDRDKKLIEALEAFSFFLDNEDAATVEVMAKKYLRPQIEDRIRVVNEWNKVLGIWRIRNEDSSYLHFSSHSYLDTLEYLGKHTNLTCVMTISENG